METRLLLLSFALRCLLIAAEVTNETVPLRERRVGSGVKRTRLHQRSIDEIIACLQNVQETGCDTYTCLENTVCDLHHNLDGICKGFLQDSVNFDLEGKSFFNDFLKCNAIGIKSQFNTSINRCVAIEMMLLSVQTECYQKYNICTAANSNITEFVNMIDLDKMLLNGAELEYVYALFNCGNNITATTRHHLQTKLGSSLNVLRQMLQECYGDTKRTAAASFSEESVLLHENTTHPHY